MQVMKYGNAAVANGENGDPLIIAMAGAAAVQRGVKPGKPL